MKHKSYFEKILVPVDGSHSCRRAEELAAFIAKKFQSKVTVIHIISHDFMHPELKANYQLPRSILHEVENWYLKAGTKILKTAEEIFKEEGIEVDTRLVKYEDPLEVIQKLVKEQRYDLIVMGNRAEKISFYAQCPVLIVKKKTKIEKLLVAIDGSKQADKALEYAVRLAQNYGAKITLLHVEEAKIFKLQAEVIEGIGERILSDAATKINGVDFDHRLEFGSPTETIVKVARQEDYDIIVVGSRGLSIVKRFFIGSVSAGVAMQARRSVLIVQ
jgi:nucleotide-binding universal stress UspA family protein